MSKDKDELIKLRIGIARVAQRAELGQEIPGLNRQGQEANYSMLHAAAKDHDRGWNRLLGFLLDAFPEREL